LAHGRRAKGLFEIQMLWKTHALAANDGTAADDWLAYHRSMDRIGVSKALNRSWLENLAEYRLTVHGTWGLDGAFRCSEPDAISTD